MHPLRRYGTPEDMANLVNWLAGDEARYASGQLWVLDGGLSAQIQQMRGLSRRAPAADGPGEGARVRVDGGVVGSAGEGRGGRCAPRGRAVSEA